MPRLLVSVRNAGEARAAIAGGAEIVDVKEPERGSLGMADGGRITEIVRETASGVLPVSAALGEAREWLAGEHSSAIPGGLRFVKLGLAGLARCEDWRHEWMKARSRTRFLEETGFLPPTWIAVAYVDWQRADAPEPDQVIQAAGDTDCAGVLFDTFHKDERCLLDWLDAGDLSRLIEAIHAADMLAAVAGGLRCEDVQRLIGTQADVFAIRTAACEQGRNSEVSESAVRRFRAAMAAAETRAAGERQHRPAG